MSIGVELHDIRSCVWRPADTTPSTLNSLTNLGLSVGASCSLSGFNSAVLEGPDLHRRVSGDMDHVNVAALPWFSSHNSHISGSPAPSGSSTVQQDSQVGQNCSRVLKRKWQQGGISTKSQCELKKSQNLLLNAEKRELSISNEMYDRPRFDTKQDAVLHQHNIQQLLQSQNNRQLQGHSQVLEALVHQHKLENQKRQRKLQSPPEMQEVELKEQRQQQMRDYLQQLALQEVHHIHPFNSNVCSRRLKQYMYHLQHRPPNSDIAYWRKFVAEYYAPCAKKRWCLSLCDDFTPHADCVFPRAAVGTWHCGLCGTKCGRGYEATFEVLPRLNKIHFESGVIDELLFLELPQECRLPSGLIMLEYEKAVHETVFDQLHVVRKGKLRVVFTLGLKILSWEFCSHNHEELLPRSSVASKVNEFVHAAQKLQTTIKCGGSDKISLHTLGENYNMLLSTGCKLQSNLDLQLVGEFELSKRYIRCLQIADVLNNMKDLMTFSWENKIGPIQSLKNYSQKFTTTKFHRDEYQEKEKLEIAHGMSNDTTKLLSTSHGLSSNKNENSNISKDGLLTGSEKAALMHASDYCKLPRQTSSSSNFSKLVESNLYKGTNQNQFAVPELFQGLKTSTPEFSQNLPLSSSHFQESNRNTHELLIQKLLQGMVNNSRAAKEPVNHIIKDGTAGLPENSKGTGISENLISKNSTSLEITADTASSSIVVKKSGFKASKQQRSSPSLDKRELTLPKSLCLPEVHNMFHGLC
ncbi:Transcriptional corepressor SEUSS, putative [Ricinus communis]|uniref:Transcriptional corepressor SEUSS, putative n=1 Tax=Ricinus communis TaxID=3988 RepID=B9RC27_RICCO|nr:Transcriptional corepressor SEUSS, putative [Ricinus communis]